MADSQAKAIRDLLVERLELFDQTLDTSSGSPLWNRVIEPVFDRLGTDPFDTDIRSFLKDRIEQEFPDISAQEGDMLVDLLVTPLEVLLEPLKREIQIIRTGQSVNNADQMRLEDARGYAANFFTTWRSGSRASTLVRVFYASPTYVNILATTRFYTSDGRNFYPTTPVLIRPETMLLQRSGTEYYVEVPVLADTPGSGGNVAAGSITAVDGLSGYTRVTNLTAAEGGNPAETGQELLDRTRSSLTERTLNVRRGIIARLQQDFPNVVDVEAIGKGDPEMQRDILTGGGQGTVIASGMCLIVGQYCLMFSMFENRGGDGGTQISVGDEVELNFWKFLYDVDQSQANEAFTVESILFDSRNAITEMPSVVLFRLDNSPSVSAPIAGTLPGVLPGVFAVVRTAGKIEISDIPGGILNPDTARGTIEIQDGEVHIGGHYDVWLRPSSTIEDAADLTNTRSESAHLEGSDLVVNGESSNFKHLVHRAYKVTVSAGAFLFGEPVTFSGGASAVIGKVDAGSGSSKILTLVEMDGTEVAAGETATGATTGATGSVTAVESYSWDEDGGVEAGMVLAIVRGSEEGSYRILKVEGSFLYLDSALTTTIQSVIFRVVSEVSVDLFDPKSIRVPFGDAGGDDLRTTIGSSTLRTAVNLQDYGVEVGDTLEILEGDDRGTFTISGFDEGIGGSAPIVSATMSSTNSGVRYRVYSAASPVQRPLVRIKPDGVAVLDPSGQDSGYRVPYALPVTGHSVGAFSGSKAVSVGANGFVVMDPGSTWGPSSDYTVDITSTNWAAATGRDFDEFYEDGDFRRAYSDEHLECDGYIAVISVYDDGSMFLDSNLPPNVTQFLQDMKDWFLGVINSFNFGGDEEELINAFSPVKFGPNTDAALTLIKQFEVCLPFALFDGCNNVFMALPEFDWQTEFAETDTFEGAIGRYNDGVLTGRDPALLQAQAGDIVTILTGNNAGSYVVDQVLEYFLVAAGQIEGSALDLDDVYKVAMVVIRDEFPVEPLYGLADYFEGTAPSWSPPASPDLPYTVTNDAGDLVGGWDFVEEGLTWFFQWMNSLGFDLPESVALDVPSTLQAFWEMLFTPYVVARPTCDQYVRLSFVEPTSCTVYAPVACARYQWAPPVPAGNAVTGETFTLPLPDLDGKTVSLTLRRLEGDVELSATLGSSEAAESGVEGLAALLQTALDPDEDYITISGSDPGASGTLTITQVTGGVDEWTYVDANDVSDGFFLLGFREAEPGKWPEISSSGSTSGLPYEVITTASAHAIGVQVEVTLSDLVHLTGTAAAGALPFQIGEIIEGGTSGARGRLFAFAHDEDGVQPPHLWVTQVTGTFSGTEVVTGQNSLETTTLTAADASPSIIDTNISDNDLAISKTFEEVATGLEGAIEEAFRIIVRGGVTSSAYDDERWSGTFTISVEWVNNGDGSGQFEITIYDSFYTFAIEEWELDNATDAAYDNPHFVATYMATVTSRPLSASVGVVTGDAYTPTTTSPTIDLDFDGSNVGDVDFDLDYFEAVAFKAAVMDLIDAADYEGAAQALNADTDYYQDVGGDRVAQWYYDGTNLVLRGMSGGTLASMVTADTALLGISSTTTAGTSPSSNTVVQGTTSAGTSETVFHGAKPPTLFVAAAGAAELLFTPSLNADPYQVFPGQDADGDIPATELPRDIRVGASYSGQLSAELAFDDVTYSSPLVLGVTESSDWVWIHEQLTMLEHTVLETDDQRSRDRVPAVRTEFGSNVIRLLEHDAAEFDFLNPGVTVGDQADNKVEVGDLIFIEEGDDAAGYTVTARSALEITLDRPLTESTLKIFRYGNDGIISPDPSNAKFTSASAEFTSEDVGRWLTIYAANRDDFDGSYLITAVESDGTGCTLDTDVWVDTEQDIHWAVVRAPSEDPGDSATGGRTELLGLRPIRLYRGTATQWRVARVSPDLDRTLARVYVSLGDSETGPKRGYRQPYKIVRPGAQRISSTAMEEQEDCGFYYFDVLAHSLGGDDIYNIPEGVRVEPVFGTYDSDGYRLEVADNRLTFSTSEECSAVMSPTMLPVSFDDRPENLLKLEGRSFRVTYDYAPTVAQVQRLMSSETDRVLCANVLARHFLPSYVSLCMTYEGGNAPSVVATEVIDYINGLPSLEELDISKVEKILHANSVIRYDHPFFVWTVTHDLDRRLVGARAENRISDDDVPYNGTNRTTFYIAGANYSATGEDVDIPPGERIDLSRQLSLVNFR